MQSCTQSYFLEKWVCLHTCTFIHAYMQTTISIKHCTGYRDLDPRLHWDSHLFNQAINFHNVNRCQTRHAHFFQGTFPTRLSSWMVGISTISALSITLSKDLCKKTDGQKRNLTFSSLKFYILCIEAMHYESCR